MVQSPACRVDTRETPATKTVDAGALCRVFRDICALAILKTFIIQEETVSAYTGMFYLLLLLRNREDT